ncbi:MAG TPA: hypothetical protein VI997_09590 [Candidatus Thermoplasmatota archaeon]|nr:hypothetical protein [Candidatus Thermoplasmatota archaeon]
MFAAAFFLVFAPAPSAAAVDLDSLLNSLDDLLRPEFIPIVHAYVAYEHAARRLIESPHDDEALDVLETSRSALEHAARSLATMDSAESVSIPGLLSVEAAGQDSFYEFDYLILIDLGGNDTYQNNAGGSNAFDEIGRTCSHETTVVGWSAFLLDLAGNDSYVPTRACGVNGGGAKGAGTLIDLSGDDIYDAPGWRTNGGAFMGFGYLRDERGNDLYTSTEFGVNGGAYGPGLGTLIDLAGDDVYRAALFGTNGGGVDFGRGSLFDLDGYDEYLADGAGVNGGGLSGFGTLVDVAGNDRYTAGTWAVNGGAAALSNCFCPPGVGVLIDLGGHDVYRSSDAEWEDRSLIPNEETGMTVDSDDDSPTP